MSRPKLWRVRVKKVVEDWVDVTALMAEDAERMAAQVPNVVSVFGRSATLAEKIYTPEIACGVEEESDIFGNPNEKLRASRRAQNE